MGQSHKLSNSALHRRDLLRAAAWAGTAVTVPSFVPSSVFGPAAPSNRITIGCIGVGNMGSSDLKAFKANPNAQVVAVCEVDAQRLEEARKLASIDKGACYSDFRELLARPDIDAVTVVTPDHWHVPICLAAVRAGKDVYCEKPLTLTILEGRILANEVKRYGRVLQTGSQQRSSAEFRQACELVRNGYTGDVKTVIAGLPSNNRKCEPTWKPEPVPEGFNYDMWLGPAEWAPYHKQRCHYEFRFLLDYSGGQVTNWGAHHLDIAQWGLGTDDTGPVRIVGQGEFPETGLFTTATKVHFEMTYASGVKLICKTGGSGTRFEGTKGWVDVKRGKLETEPASLKTQTIGAHEMHLYESRNHHQNFLDCIKSRQAPIANVEVGHRSATLCHLGNIAMLLKRPLKWDPVKEEFLGDDAANRLRWRPRRAPWNG